MASGNEKEKELKFIIHPVGRACKDLNNPTRRKKEADKTRGYQKLGMTITNEEIKKMREVAKREKELGYMEYCKSYKGNKLSVINRFLFDTTLQPKERICYRYIATPERCKGKLRDKTIISVNYTSDLKYELQVEGETKGIFKNQELTVEYIKKMIGWRD